MRNNFALLGLGVSALALCGHAGVAAQESAGQSLPAGQEAEAASTGNEIVVTGTRLRRSAADSPVPLQVLGAEGIEETGTGDLYEAVELLPGVSGGITPEGSVSSVQSSGLSTISLRRLGDNRTLTLIDGRRAVSNSGNSDRVSLSTIPSGFVERVEVTTGGASAIYGSDAVAGVVNIILKDDVDGLELNGRISTPEASGGEEYRIEGLWGTRFADDRGYLMLSASWRDENGIRADATRPESVAALEFNSPASPASDAWAGETCNNDDPDFHCLLPDASISTPGGVFEGDAWYKNGQWFNDKSLRPSDRPEGSDFLSDHDGYDFRTGRTLRPERKVLTLGLHSTFEVSDVTEFTVSALYSDVSSRYYTGYETLNDNDSYGLLDAFSLGNLPSDHPFIPPEVEETRSGSVSFDRRVVELGEQQRYNERRTYRLAAAFDGQMTDNAEWSLYATYGHFSQAQENPNELNFRRANWALDVEPDGNGGFQCASAEARADGCVPLNIFGEGSITQAAADYIRYNGYGEQTRDQVTAGGYISGDFANVMGMELLWAAGAEFRHEEQDTFGDPDGDLVGGIDGDPATDDVLVTSLSSFPSIAADYQVFEFFGEADLEVIPDRLRLQVAGRYGDYTTVGGVFSYNVGGVFNVTDDFLVRGQYSRSQRAPNITEFFSPPRPDADDLTDPCEGLLPDGSGLSQPRSVGGENVDLAVVRANCLSEPGIQAYFAHPDYEAGDPFDPGGSVQGPNAGNNTLKEETADTWTAGFVYQPNWSGRNLSLIVDYFKISIDDVISSVSTQNTVDLCYASDSFPDNKFCDVITRNPVSGEVSQVINRVENLVSEVVEGVDAQLNWRRIDLGVPGLFDIDLRYSHYFKDEQSFLDLVGNEITNDYLPYIGNPSDELLLKIGYRLDGFRLSYTMTYESGGVDDPVNFPEPGDLEYYAIGGQDFHRIYAAYDFGPGERFRVYGGVNNLFDTIGKIYPTGTLGGSSYNINHSLADSVGREFYLGLRARF